MTYPRIYAWVCVCTPRTHTTLNTEAGEGGRSNSRVAWTRVLASHLRTHGGMFPGLFVPNGSRRQGRNPVAESSRPQGVLHSWVAQGTEKQGLLLVPLPLVLNPLGKFSYDDEFWVSLILENLISGATISPLSQLLPIGHAESTRITQQASG